MRAINEYTPEQIEVLRVKRTVAMNEPTQQPTAQSSHPVPEYILIAARDLCEYMSPLALAQLVCEWCDEPGTIPLAQIALDEGIRNCGLTELLSHIPQHEEVIIEMWEKAGLQFVKPRRFTKP